MGILLIIIGIILAIIGEIIFCKKKDLSLGLLIGGIAGGVTGLGISLIIFM